VNTQFQYIDVGVNIDVTPHVHSDREVSLKITMEISSELGQANIGGITQPIIGQKKVDLGEIRLKDGESSLIGGILDDSQTKSLSGIPGLAQIPILKYLFGQTSTDHSSDETVFAITPHIVRGTDVNEINQRAIDIGTANTIQLRHVSRPLASTAAPGQVPSQPANPSIQPQSNQAPASQSPAPNSTAGGTASFLFDPPTIQAVKGNTFAVNLVISGAQNVHSVPVQLNYDPKMLQLVNVSNGGFLSQDGQAVALVHREDESIGQSQITATRPPGAGGVSGQGSVVTLTFMAKLRSLSLEEAPAIRACRPSPSTARRPQSPSSKRGAATLLLGEGHDFSRGIDLERSRLQPCGPLDLGKVTAQARKSAASYQGTASAVRGS
jgi:general secretion pathway protein D